MVAPFISKLYESRILMILCRSTLAVVFILAAVGKILDPKEFSDAVAAFRILPITSVNVFAIVLPWIELIGGLALLHKASLRSGVIVVFGLNLVFLIAISSAMARGLDIECGCFTLSNAHDKVGWALLARDAVLLVLCIPILRGLKVAKRQPVSKGINAQAKDSELLHV